MKSDVIIVGAELDGQVAALRLLEHGHSVRLFARGGGSQHYAPGGVRVLGYDPRQDDAPLTAPLEAMGSLDPRHPYRIIERERVGKALHWFFATALELGQDFVANGDNTTTLTPIGLGLPTFAPGRYQARLDALRSKRVVIAEFRGHRDFPARLVALALARQGFSVDRIAVDPPEGKVETIALAQAFDRLADPQRFFQAIAARLPPETDIVLFPAVLGLESHARILGAAATLEIDFLEVPTQPPSVPGLRLTSAFERRLSKGGVALHLGAQVRGSTADDGKITAVTDERAHCYDAETFILANGGVLMGGLDVASCGTVSEPTFDLEVRQTAPLAAERVDDTLDALQRVGIDVDEQLRPCRRGLQAHDNLFVTGSTLGHWNPAQEASAEGVSIATGWAAAEAAHAYLEGR